MSTNELREIINTVVERIQGQKQASDEGLPWTACIFGDCSDEIVAYYAITEPTDPNRKTP